MECQNCGATNEADNDTCIRCGVPLTTPNSQTTSALLQQAYLAYKQEDMETALLRCRQLLKADPENEEALTLMAQLEEKQEHYLAATELYERLTKLRPESMAYRLRLEELKHKAQSRSSANPSVAPSPDRTGDSRISVVLILSTTSLMLAAAVAILAYEWGRTTQLNMNRSSLPPSIVERPAASSPSFPWNASPFPGPSSAPNTAPLPTEPPQPSRRREGGEAPQAALSSGLSHASIGVAPMHFSLPPATAHPVPPSRSTTSSQRIVLPANDASGGSDENTVVIPVSGSTPLATNNGSTFAAPSSQGTTVVRVYRTSSASGSADDSSARSYIAMGQHLQLSGQYDQAIEAYRKALPSAGDEAGFVYQQIALCYQREGKKAEAADNFRQAKAAYQQLLEAGRKVAEARAGIIACEQGIKLCSP
ncbi:TPR repeat/Tetratricopeptide repeat [Chthonomonas calidirosea]|uniref:tetratricopeptide repeat protein n=1 Tax=Chthonomonas calidirosea TaxID=454171 RepID=UPI0006DD53F5|nr:tetratricopeptide repeat protein [Chthonomonas calidirosea]CEK18063.1 TPR repeat/Tetratricopeptide repeat [Chthonomonas calidirosea]